MLTQEIIKKKRDGGTLNAEDICAYVSGVTDNSVSEGQIAAMCMAIFFNKLNIEERTALTLAMRDSGRVLEWKDLQLNGPVMDKHSTGGVGDVVSLMLAPMVAACGAYVPMISGRGWATPAARWTNSRQSRALTPSPSRINCVISLKPPVRPSSGKRATLRHATNVFTPRATSPRPLNPLT